MKKFSSIFAFLLFTYTGVSQTVFQKKLIYSSPSSNGNQTRDIQITDDGGSILLRNEWDNTFNKSCIRIIKANYLGNIEWMSNFYSDTTSIPGTKSLFGFTIKQTNDLGYIILGQNSLDGVNNNMTVLIKIDNGGNIQWNKYYSATSTFGIDVIQTNDGGYIVTGGTSAPFYEKLCLIKTNSSGSIIWERILTPSSVYSYGGSVQETSDKGFFITGRCLGSNNPLLIKIDSSCNVIWAKNYPFFLSSYSYEYGEITKDGGSIITIYDPSLTSPTYLLKVNTNGDVIWLKNYYSGCYSRIQQTSDNGYVLCGSSSNFGAGTSAGTLLKTDSLGNVSFLTTIHGLRSNFFSVKQTSDHGYVIAGDHIPVPSNPGMLFIKTDSIGLSGCNNITASVTVYQYTISATTETVISVPYGSYTVGILPINNIMSNDTTTTNLCAVQSVLEINNQNFIKIFPNPTTGELVIQTQGNSKSNKLKLINLIGETIWEKEAIQNDEIIDISKQPCGVYFLELNQSGNISRAKIIKE